MISKDPHWSGSLDPDVDLDPHWDKKLNPDPNPHWNQCGFAKLVNTDIYLTGYGTGSTYWRHRSVTFGSQNRPSNLCLFFASFLTAGAIEKQGKKEVSKFGQASESVPDSDANLCNTQLSTEEKNRSQASSFIKTLTDEFQRRLTRAHPIKWLPNAWLKIKI